MNTTLSLFSFHKNSTEPNSGLDLLIQPSYNFCYLEFSGSGNFKALLQGKVNDKWQNLIGINISDMSYNSEITNLEGIWEVSLKGLNSFRIELIEVEETISIQGRVVT